MQQRAENAPPLSPHWAFVVRFRVETDLEQGSCTGRVKHVVSGQTAHFQSLDELLAFLTRVLTAVRAQTPNQP